MKRALAGLGIALSLLAAILLLRTGGLASRQLDVETPKDRVAVDARALAEGLSALIQIPTISHFDRSRVEAEAFERLHAELARRYPRVHATLERETVEDWSLLYTWRGSDPAREPVLLAAHQDVVPIDPGSEADWERPPFSGHIEAGEDGARGFVWGRGAIDDKASLVCLLEATESLLAEGFAPRRTVYLAFGHDEEVGGHHGAKAIAAELERRGVRLAYGLDEGGIVAEAVFPPLGDRPVALIGVAEKGSVSVRLSVESPGGHSSMPPRQSGVGVVAAAVAALEARPMPTRLPDTTRRMFHYLAPELPLGFRVGLANLWLFEPLLLRAFAATPSLDATIRTTTAATMFHGGAKENVLPKRVEAVVNFRILPGDTVEDVVAHVRRVIDDGRIRVEIAPGTTPRNPSDESPTDAASFALVQRTVAAVFADVVVAPFLVLGGTDARHYARLTQNLYRFLPIRADAEMRTWIHGTNERIPVDDLVTSTRFYRRLLVASQQLLESPDSGEAR